MNSFLTTENITFALGILAIIFSVYNYFRKPQEELDKRQSVNEKEAEGKSAILAQKVEWEKEANEKKFVEFGVRLDSALGMAQNHIHTIDVKVDNLIDRIAAMGNEITRLSTIIEERIPKK